MVDYLEKVKTFLDANPNEVLTLLFTNPEGQNISTVWKPAFDTAGEHCTSCADHIHDNETLSTIIYVQVSLPSHTFLRLSP